MLVEILLFFFYNFVFVINFEKPRLITSAFILIPQKFYFEIFFFNPKRFRHMRPREFLWRSESHLSKGLFFFYISKVYQVTFIILFNLCDLTNFSSCGVKVLMEVSSMIISSRENNSITNLLCSSGSRNYNTERRFLSVKLVTKLEYDTKTLSYCFMFTGTKFFFFLFHKRISW